MGRCEWLSLGLVSNVLRRVSVLQEDTPIPDPDKASLRNDLVPAMIALSQPTDKAVRAQIAESISLIASADFPEPWSDLIDVRAPALRVYGH